MVGNASITPEITTRFVHINVDARRAPESMANRHLPPVAWADRGHFDSRASFLGGAFWACRSVA